MVNSTESNSLSNLINARCSVAIEASAEYKENERELDKALKSLNPKTMIHIDELITRQQIVAEELIYKQGLKDALSLFR